MPPRKDPIESMSPAEKLLRVGVIGGTALLLVLATVSSFRDGPGQNGAPQVAEAPAAEEDDSEEAASADDAPEPAPEDEEESVETAEAEPEAEADAEAEEETASAEDDAARGDEDSEVETAEAEDDSAQAETDTAEESGSDNWLEESPLLASADIDAEESPLLASADIDARVKAPFANVLPATNITPNGMPVVRTLLALSGERWQPSRTGAIPMRCKTQAASGRRNGWKNG